MLLANLHRVHNLVPHRGKCPLRIGEITVSHKIRQVTDLATDEYLGADVVSFHYLPLIHRPCSVRPHQGNTIRFILVRHRIPVSAFVDVVHIAAFIKCIF